MRRTVLLVGLIVPAALAAAGALLSAAVQAEENAGETASVNAAPRPPGRDQNCLSGGDMREAVSERRVVEPLAAIRAARAAVPKAEIVRVYLCHGEGEALVYLITALRRDGQFVRVTVDSQSGAVTP